MLYEKEQLPCEQFLHGFEIFRAFLPLVCTEKSMGNFKFFVEFFYVDLANFETLKLQVYFIACTSSCTSSRNLSELIKG